MSKRETGGNEHLSSAATTTSIAPSRRRMRPGGGKAKGNGFEGLVAKKLSAALPLNFIRSPGSGARVGGKNFEKLGAMFGEDTLKVFVADVVPINERQEKLRFNFSIECKSYATPDNFSALASGSANLFKWFEEAVVDSKKVGKKPMLVFKWNRTSIFVAVSSQDLYFKSINPKLSITRYEPEIELGSRVLDIYELDDLLQHPNCWVSPE